MWGETYLETCCRSALHRLVLSGAAGRPADGADASCLARLAEAGMAARRADGRWEPTETGARFDAGGRGR